MDIAKKILTEIEKKEKLNKDLDNKLAQIVQLKLDESNKRAELMSGDLTNKIEGKVTEKAKVAYCDKILRGKIKAIEWLDNDVGKIKRMINLCDDKISAYKYMIREMEL